LQIISLENAQVSINRIDLIFKDFKVNSKFLQKESLDDSAFIFVLKYNNLFGIDAYVAKDYSISIRLFHYNKFTHELVDLQYVPPFHIIPALNEVINFNYKYFEKMKVFA